MPEEYQSVFEAFMKNADSIRGSKLYEEKDIYATAPEAIFYDRAVEEFWRDPIGGFSDKTSK